jgi:hypothetical protein
MTEQTTELLATVTAADLSIEQLRLLERSISALKKSKMPKKGESDSAIAKRKSMEKHAVNLSAARSALTNGQEAKAREAMGCMPMVCLRELAAEAKVAGRSKIEEKPDLISAIVAKALAEVEVELEIAA